MSLQSLLVPLFKLYLCGMKVLLYQMFNRSFALPVLPKQNGRVAIVTGGTRGIGFETARHLASLGMHVIIAGNEREEGAAAVRKIHEERTEGTAEFVFVDMTSLKSVRQFVRLFRVRGLPLHVLVNNAGTMMVPERQTEDGFEYHLGLNYLSHFLLTNLLLDLLKRSGNPGCCSRIINMSSATHYAGVVDMEDLNRRIQYSSHGAYSQSKLALVLFTYCLQEQLTASSCSVTVNAVDPGMVDTALYDNLWTVAQLLKKPVAKILFRVRTKLFIVFSWSVLKLLYERKLLEMLRGFEAVVVLCFAQTPAEGASTAVYAAAAGEMEGVGSCYLYNGQKTQSAGVSYDSELQATLWKKSCQLVGLQEA